MSSHVTRPRGTPTLSVQPSVEVGVELVVDRLPLESSGLVLEVAVEGHRDHEHDLPSLNGNGVATTRARGFASAAVQVPTRVPRLSSSARSSTASEATHTFEHFADDVVDLAMHLGSRPSM